MYSGEYLQGHGLCRSQHDILGHRLRNIDLLVICLPRVRVLLSQPIGFGGGLPGAGISAAEMVLPYRLRRADRDSFFQQQ